MAEDKKGPTNLATLGTGMGIAAGQGILDQIFLERNIKAQKRMGKFNQALALETWEKTGPVAQRKQLEKAGLNVGLMYEGGGPTGTTAGGKAEGTELPAPQLGMAMQSGLMAQQAKATIELTQAQTEKVKAETPKVGAEKEATEAGTALTKVQTAIAEIERNIKNLTQNQIVDQIDEALKTAIANTKSTEAKAQKDQATVDEEIKIMEQNVLEQGLRMLAIKAGLVKTGAETNAINAGIQKMAAEVENMLVTQKQNWNKLNQNERELLIKAAMAKNAREMTSFHTNLPSHIKQWTDIITDLVSTTAGALKD